MRVLFLTTYVLLVIVPTMAVAQSRIVMVTWRGCEDACRGFQDYVREKGLDVEVEVRDANQDKEAIPGILAESLDEKADLLVSWGTTVTTGIAGTLANRDTPPIDHGIPVVFMIVADPVGAGIVDSLDDTGRDNVTGTYNRVPEVVNIETIRNYLPNFSRLGLIYNMNEENSVLKRNEMAALAEKMGYELVAKELPLGAGGEPSVEDIGPAMAELKQAGVEFVYLGSSSFLRRNGETFTEQALANGMPVLSPYEGLVKDASALLSVSSRYYEVGRLAGQQAEKILAGTPAGELPVARMTDFAIVINIEVAKKLKLFPPLDLIQIAETVD
ncbi:ABC transporter substrate-binding protein [uncultured Roseibium sp.]|uniref:ABC transporter substrate-binding protein n=1 Tax=uncultured Roseibium sp. TaxID=1936171 RepID=UPI0032171F68